MNEPNQMGDPQTELERLRAGIGRVAQAIGLEREIPGRLPDEKNLSFERIAELAQTHERGWHHLLACVATPTTFLIIREFHWADGGTSQMVLSAVRDHEVARKVAKRLDAKALNSRHIRDGMRLLGLEQLRHNVLPLSFLNGPEAQQFDGWPT